MPAKTAIVNVIIIIGQACNIEPLAASVRIFPSSCCLVITTTPGTCITGINLLYALCPYEVFVTGNIISCELLSLLLTSFVLPCCSQ